MSYLEFGAGDIRPCSFTFGQAFHCPPKPPFFLFAWVTAQARLLAIACTSCQGLRCHKQWIVTGFDMSLMDEIQIGMNMGEHFLQKVLFFFNKTGQ